MEDNVRKLRGSQGDDFSAPRDRYRLVYICCVIVGAGVLTPWTSYIAAIDYFFYYYMREFPTVSVAIPVSYLVITFLFGTLNIFLVSKVNVHVRITFGYIMFCVSLLTIPLLDFWLHNCAIYTAAGFYITLFSVAIVGMGSGVQQSSYYGLSSMLPRRYTQAIMAGESLAGILESGFRIITKATVESERVGALVFFGFSLLFIVICFICHRFIKGHEMVLYYVNKCSNSSNSKSLKKGLSDTGEELELFNSHGHQEDIEPLLISESYDKSGGSSHNGSSHLTNLSSAESEKYNTLEGRADRMAGSSSDSEHPAQVLDDRTLLTRNIAGISSVVYQRVKHCWIVVLQIWPLMGAIFVSCFVTLLVFPGILAEVQNCWLGLWTPVLLVTSFNLTDFIAKWVTLIHITWTPKQLLYCSMARVIFIPLIVLCVSPSPSHPFLSRNTVVWAILFTLLFGLSSGYFGSLPLINLSPEVKQERDRELAGTIMTMTLLAGLLVGSVCAYALTPLTTLQHSEHQCYSDTVQYFMKCSNSTM